MKVFSDDLEPCSGAVTLFPGVRMADLDYSEIKVYPGNYDDFMMASTQARERQYAGNAKNKSQITDLQAFVQRFKANRSKACQATSQQKQTDNVAVTCPNVIGKTTFVKMLARVLAPNKGELKWTETANIGYFAQDHEDDFNTAKTILDCVSQWSSDKQDEQQICGILGRLLFGKDGINKPVNVVSGG